MMISSQDNVNAQALMASMMPAAQPVRAAAATAGPGSRMSAGGDLAPQVPAGAMTTMRGPDSEAASAARISAGSDPRVADRLAQMSDALKGVDAETTDGSLALEKLGGMMKATEVMMKAMQEMMRTLEEMQEQQAQKVQDIARKSGIPVFEGMRPDVAEALARNLELREAGEAEIGG